MTVLDPLSGLEDLLALAQELGENLRARGLRLVTAESCTGGWASAAITAIPGSSHWYERGYITYSNAAKREDLGVRANTLATFGAVSGETAAEMAHGALERGSADISVAITGIAGPDGGSPGKPVGTVWIAVQRTGQPPQTRHHCFSGDRQSIRQQAVVAALRALIGAVAD
jgi:nicotinamide-nucleotide amidase